MKKHIAAAGDNVVFDWKKSLWLYLFLVPSLIFIWPSLSLNLAIIAFALTFLTVSLGHSIGLHRGVIHRSYMTSRGVRGLLLYLFVQTGLGSPLAWLRLHYVRDYWQNQNDAPAYLKYDHSLMTDYWWYLHLSYRPSDLTKYHIPEEDLNDPWLRWLDKTWRWHVLGACGLVWLLFGFEVMIVTMAGRVAITQLGHWFIGYVTHKYGYRHYTIRGANQSGTNDWLLGLISFGEGFHNNHHAFPQSARFGIGRYEIDLSWYAVWFLEKTGLIWEVKDGRNDSDLLKEHAEKHGRVWNPKA